MTLPYYRDEYVTLYHGDCREVAEWLSADVLVTDPPYGTQMVSTVGDHKGGYGRRYLHDSGDGKGANIANDEDPTCRNDMLALWAGRPACIFGSPRMAEPPGVWADRLVWDKKRLGTNGGPWRYRHESIFVTAGFVRTSDAAGSILTAWPDQSDHIHAKPVGLMAQLIAAAPQGTIADPFAGSGSTLVAAKQLGRRCVGVEFDESYCDVTAMRLSQGVLEFA